jgi:hypothetical protein
MDPVSIAAGAIAFLQAAAVIGKGIQALRALGRAPEEVCSLINELVTLQALASKFEQDLALLNTRCQERSPGGDESQLEHLHGELSSTVTDLHGLVHRFISSSKGLNKDGHHRIPRLRWQLEREHINHLRNKARTTREYLTAFMTLIQVEEGYVDQGCSSVPS